MCFSNLRGFDCKEEIERNVYTSHKKSLLNSAYCLEVTFKAIDILMKLLKNELVFHGINKHVMKISCEIVT